jgi:hypothetical protein
LGECVEVETLEVVANSNKTFCYTIYWLYGLLKNLSLFFLLLTTVTMQIEIMTRETRIEPRTMIPIITYLLKVDSDLVTVAVELTGAATSPTNKSISINS